MTGTVTVKEAPVATPTPTPPPPPAGGAPPPPPPQLRSLKLVRTSFCTQRSRTCKRPGVVLSIDLSAPATVRGTLRRASLRGKARYQAFGSVDFGQVAAGPRQLRFTRTKTNRRLTPARYRLVLQTAGTTRTFSFRVRR
jgi:hypothetical protein